MLYLANDHRGFELMKQIIKYLEEHNIAYEHVGAFDAERSDFPIFAKIVNANVIADSNNKGIYICGTGLGACIAANRNKRIRAAVCNSIEVVKLAREHNDLNVLCLAGNTMKIDLAIEIIEAFLTTPFNGGRYAERITMLYDL